MLPRLSFWPFLPKAGGSRAGSLSKRVAFLAGLAWIAGASVQALDSSAGLDRLNDVDVLVGDEPYHGALIPPPTDTEFSFKLAETGDVVTFRWSQLAESERRRIQKLFGIEVNDTGRLDWGEKIKCLKLKLKTGKSAEGLEVPDRAYMGYRCLKTSTQLLQYPKTDVDGEEVIEKRESDIFSAKEYYDKKLLERPPASDSAADHLEFARLSSTIGLYEKAIDHLEFAKAIDPRTEDRTQDFRSELVRKYNETQAEKLYHYILTARLAGDNASALEKIDRFLRNFPSSDYRTRVEAVRPGVEEGSKADFTKQIIFMYYHLARELIRERMNKKVRVDEKGRPVLAQPGKQITTKNSRIFRGELTSESDEKTVLKMGDTTLEIPGKEILSKQDVDLSKAFRTIEPTFAELKTFVTDVNGGLGKAILSRISQLLKVDENKVRDTWAARFNRSGKLDGELLTLTPIYTSLHTAFYGKGAWLRDGANAAAAQNNPGRNTGRNNGGRNSGGRNSSTGDRSGTGTGTGFGTGGTGGAGGTGGNTNTSGAVRMVFQTDERGDPESSDDPEYWWAAQSSETRAGILLAFAAEKLFRVKQVNARICPSCSGRGGIEIWDNFGNRSLERCPTCRGLTKLAQVHYE